jgi:hypothetical protein
MRYEQLSIALSTAACDALSILLSAWLDSRPISSLNPSGLELLNLRNELRARLQRTDQDIQYDGSDLT